MWLVLKIIDSVTTKGDIDVATGKNIDRTLSLKTNDVFGACLVYNDYDKAKAMFPDSEIIECNIVED